MSERPKMLPPDLNYNLCGEYLHIILDKAGAVQADGKGLLSDPPRLMTVTERIVRLGEDNQEHVRQARYWRKIAEGYGAK